jgi:hypothetical protein
VGSGVWGLGSKKVGDPGLAFSGFGSRVSGLGENNLKHVLPPDGPQAFRVINMPVFGSRSEDLGFRV